MADWACGAGRVLIAIGARALVIKGEPIGDAADSQHALHVLGWPTQAEAVTVVARASVSDDQHPDSRAGQKRQIAQVDDDRGCAGRFDANEFALDVAGVGDIHLAGQTDRVHVAVALRAHQQLTQLDELLGSRMRRQQGRLVGHLKSRWYAWVQEPSHGTWALVLFAVNHLSAPYRNPQTSTGPT